MLARVTLELADIVRGAGPRYRASHAGRVLPSQQRALDDIARCRTAALGGAVYQCDACGTRDFAYHSCRNRHCPKCQADRAQRWLDAVRVRLLPSAHFLVTFTLPAELRGLARAHQRVVYAALLREAAAALQTIASDPAWVGGQLGILAVLHTWTRTLEYPPPCSSRRDRGRARTGRHHLATARISTFSHAGISPLGSVSAAHAAGPDASRAR